VQFVGQLPVTFIESVVPLWRLVAKWTSPVAERHAAVHAAARLFAALVRVERLLNLSEVVDPIVNRTVTGFLPMYL
jgi:hypothetical protein